MGLKLVTGPVNANKARSVFDQVRDWLAEGQEPFLVVPTGADVDRYRREIVRTGPGQGVEFGLTVCEFSSFQRQLEAQLLPYEKVLSDDHLERLVRTWLLALPKNSGLRLAADRKRSRRRVLELVEELQERGLSPEDLVDQLGTLTDEQGGFDRTLLNDLKAVFEGAGADLATKVTRGQRLRQLRMVLPDRQNVFAHPIGIYGFDDLTPPQRDLVLNLSEVCDVVISVPYSERQPATVACAQLVSELQTKVDLLKQRGDRFSAVESLPAVEQGPAGIKALARNLFSSPPRLNDPELQVANDVVHLMVADQVGMREAVVSQVLQLVGPEATSQVNLDEIVVAIKGAERQAGTELKATLESFGLPCFNSRTVPLLGTRLGRIFAGLVQVYGQRFSAPESWTVLADLLLNSADPNQRDVIDRVTFGFRQRSRASAADLFALFTGSAGADVTPLRLDGLLADVHSRVQLISQGKDKQPELDQLLTGLLPEKWCSEFAESLGSEEPDQIEENHAAYNALQGYVERLKQIRKLDSELLPNARQMVEELSATMISYDSGLQTGSLQIAEPIALRGRHAKVMIVADLSESNFPEPERIDPLIDRDVRQLLADRQLAGASLAVKRPKAEAEMLLFQQLVTRPTERLVFITADTGVNGKQQAESRYVAELYGALAVEGLKPDIREQQSNVRLLPQHATDHDTLGAATVVGLADDLDPQQREAISHELSAIVQMSVSDLEQLASCPVCWLVERYMRASDGEPDSEQQVLGSLVHETLARIFSSRLNKELESLDLAAALEEAQKHLEQLVYMPSSVGSSINTGHFTQANKKVLLATATRSVATALQAFKTDWVGARVAAVEHDVESDQTVLGRTVTLTGRVDRIDQVLTDGSDERPASSGFGVVDYKWGSGSVRAAGSWLEKLQLQIAIYLRLLREKRGEDAVYGVYQRLMVSGGLDDKLDKPKGAVAAQVNVGTVLKGSKSAPSTLQELPDQALALALERLQGVLSGDLSRPVGSSHGDPGGCRCSVVARDIASRADDESGDDDE